MHAIWYATFFAVSFMSLKQLLPTLVSALAAGVVAEIAMRIVDRKFVGPSGTDSAD